ncbi:MAG: serine/threonine protein kinase [Ktedonobacteraceae bacterium]|nr:serine/threonine protein kinase [Ktedonobacteraceae bacterium]
MLNYTGRQLGNYRLLRLLGQGGFADVYLGEHVYLNTLAAIKVLRTQLVHNDLQIFLTEARTIANLTHPHIVRVLEFGVEVNTPFLVMDYAPDGTLRQRHPKGSRLSLTEVVSYVQQVAAALHYAHDRKVIHRDIKPENMLVGRDGKVLLSDFGIAVVAQSSRHQSSQPVGGTVAYMAPEQLQGKATAASDQYSLGIVVYEWLSGAWPFNGSFAEVGSQHLFATPQPLASRVPGIAPIVEQIVQMALAKEQQQRFKSVQAFAHALEQAKEQEQSTKLRSVDMPPLANQSLVSTYVKPVLPQQQYPPQIARDRSGGSGRQPVVGQPSVRSPQFAPMSAPNITPQLTPGGLPPVVVTPPVQPAKSRSHTGYVVTIVVLILMLLGVSCWSVSLLANKQLGSTNPGGITTPSQNPTGTSGGNAPQANSAPTSLPTASSGVLSKKIHLRCDSCNDPIRVDINTITIDTGNGRMLWDVTLTNISGNVQVFYLSDFTLQSLSDGTKYSGTGDILGVQNLPAGQNMEGNAIFSFVPFHGATYKLTAQVSGNGGINFNPVTITF